MRLHQNFLKIAVSDAIRYRDGVKPLPILEPLDPREVEIERAIDRVDVSICDFVLLANDSTPEQALTLHARLEKLLVSLGCAADVAKDRSLGPRP